MYISYIIWIYSVFCQLTWFFNFQAILCEFSLTCCMCMGRDIYIKIYIYILPACLTYRCQCSCCSFRRCRRSPCWTGKLFDKPFKTHSRLTVFFHAIRAYIIPYPAYIYIYIYMCLSYVPLCTKSGDQPKFPQLLCCISGDKRFYIFYSVFFEYNLWYLTQKFMRPVQIFEFSMKFQYLYYLYLLYFVYIFCLKFFSSIFLYFSHIISFLIMHIKIYTVAKF